MTHTIVQSTKDHVLPIARNARPSDTQEVAAAGGRTVEEALLDGLRVSSRCRTIMDGEIPIAMFGVAPDVVTGLGIVWMLGTPLMDEARMFILRNSVKEIEGLHTAGGHTLYNYIDVRNEASMNWLKWCGFETVGDPEIMGVGQVPFLLFMRYQNV